MEFYLLKPDWNKRGNLDWHYLSYDGDLDDLSPLRGLHPLAAIWNPPSVELKMEKRPPNIYKFDLRFAVDLPTRDVLAPIIGADVEFLPLRLDGDQSLFVIHPLYATYLDANANYRRGSNNGNIIVIDEYSFSQPKSFYGKPCQAFAIRHPADSPAGRNGSVRSDLIVTQEVCELFETNSISGVRPRQIFTA